MFEFVPIKHGGGVIVDSKPQQKFEKPDNCILECVQNAIDAASEKNSIRQKTILKFHFTQVKKSDCNFFDKNFEDHLKVRRYGKRNDFDESISCLVMEDFSTTGITGDPNIPDYQTSTGDKNNWYHFLIDFGGQNKLQDAKKGGSEGEGRQTFMLNSGIATFFGLSVDSKNNNRPSIFGMSYFGSRKVNNVTYPAFSSFGKKVKYEDNDECVPVSDPEKAKKFISLFNLKRKISDPGTSIVIPFYNKDDISSEFIIERLINIYRVPILKNELEVFVGDIQINSSNLRSLVDAREENPDKKMLYQDYFNFLNESENDLPPENNFEVNFYDDEELGKENIQDFEKLIQKFNENKLLKLKLSFQIKKLKDNIRFDAFTSHIDIYLKKYPSNLDNIRETFNDFIRGQMPLYQRRNKKTSMFHLVNIQEDHAMLLFKHAEQANHSEISADNWKLKDEYKGYKPIIRLSKSITTKLYNLITSENLEEDYEATQDLFQIDEKDKGQKPDVAGGTEVEEDIEEIPEDTKITDIIVPPIIESLKPYEVTQKNEGDGTITLNVNGVTYKEKDIKRKIEDAQKYLKDVKKIDYSKYATEDGKKQIERMKKKSYVCNRKLVEYKNFLANGSTFYPRRIEIDAGFEGEGIRNSIKKYKPRDFDFSDKTFKLNLTVGIKLKSREKNNISLLANKSDFKFSINGFGEGIEDVRWSVRNYAA